MTSLVPENLEELKQLWHFLGYYRKFISNFATIAAPLYKLTETCAGIWTTEYQFNPQVTNVNNLL